MRPLLYLLIATLFYNTTNAQFVFTKLGVPTLSLTNFDYTTNRWAVHDGKVYFTCTTNDYGTELWGTDGTPAGTKIVRDIYHDSWNGVTALSAPPPATQEAPDLRMFNGKMHFSANDSTHGTELWYSDGSASGTQMLIDIMVGRFRGCYFKENAVYNGKLYFAADSNQYQGTEPWVTDGTAQGTFLLKDINPAFLQMTNSSNPRGFHQNFGLLFFFANTSNSTTLLFQTNGTTIGTVPVVTDTMPPNLQLSKAPAFKNKTFYLSNGNIWTYDGSFPGMTLLSPPGMLPINTMEGSIEYNGKIYFSAADTAHGSELWTTDGTTAGTTMFKDIFPGKNSSTCNNFTIHKGLLYFTATDTLGSEPWVTDGTPAGTHIVADVIPGNKGSNPHTYTSANDRLFFIGLNNFGFKFLYYSDGTDTGTHRLEPPGASNDSTHNMGYKKLGVLPMWAGYTIHDKSIYVYAKYDTTWYNLWKIEDTSTVDTGTSIRTAGIAEELSVNIYPNPAHTYLTIKTTASYKHGVVNIKDITGRVVQTATMQQGAATEIILDNIAPGVYLVDIWLDERRKSQRLVIQ